MFGRKVFAACLALASSITSVHTAPAVGAAVEERDVVVTSKTVFVPPSNYITPKVLYGRTVQLADGTLLATW
jgi:hypothetical protein